MSFSPSLPCGIGQQIIDDGASGKAYYRIAQNNGTKNRSDYPNLFSKIGLTYGKYCTFNASNTPVPAVSGYSSPAGYSVSDSTHQSGYEGWKLFDGNDTTFWGTTTYLNQYSELTIPSAIVPFSFKAVGYDTKEYMPTNFAIQGYDGSSYFDFVHFDGLAWSNAETKIIAPTTIAPSAKFKAMCYMCGPIDISNAEFRFKSLYIYGADLTKIKCTGHGYSNGDAVTVDALTGTLPAGLTKGTVYYARSVDADNITLYDTQAHAIAGGATGLIALTDAGSGTFKIWNATTFPVGNVTNGYLASDKG